MKLYAHPFSSYSQKVLIALYENVTPFEYRNLEEPAANAELATLWPLKRFPVLLDDGRCILESSTIVAHLQAHHPGPVCLVPPGDAGLEVHMLDRVFDNYVMTPMQKVVLDMLRPAAERDRYGVVEARELLRHEQSGAPIALASGLWEDPLVRERLWDGLYPRRIHWADKGLMLWRTPGPQQPNCTEISRSERIVLVDCH